MYTIKMKKSGEEFTADLINESTNLNVLFVHLIDTTAADAATAFTDPENVDIEGYEDYTVFNSMNITPGGGINICLVKGDSA